jgi:hypothetical protein
MDEKTRQYKMDASAYKAQFEVAMDMNDSLTEELVAMRCCGNCKHDYVNEGYQQDCKLGLAGKYSEYGGSGRDFTGQGCHKWTRRCHD